MSKVLSLLGLIILLVAILGGLFYKFEDEICEKGVEYGLLQNHNGTLCIYYKELEEYHKFSYGLKSPIKIKDIKNSGCDVYMQVNNRKLFFRTLLYGLPTVVLGETYVNGYWEAYNMDLSDLAYYFVINANKYPTFINRFKYANRWFFHDFSNVQTHSHETDRKDIEFHYNVGNDFYEAMLDTTVSYSCALFTSPNSTLFEGQINKYNLLMKLMRLNNQSKDTVLDIGSGWGFFVGYMGNFSKKMQVHGIGLAQNQIDYSNNRYGKYESNIKYILRDYRDIPPNTYDKIVSIEVLEHVGLVNLGLFMETTYNSLKPGGLLVIQYNDMGDVYPKFLDGSRATACKGVNFVSKYVFPAACMLNRDWVIEAAYMAGYMLLDEEGIGFYQAKTFRIWRQNLMANYPKLLKANPKYNMTLIKIYEFYLGFVEANLATHRIHDLIQVFYKPLKPKPQWSDYKDFLDIMAYPHGQITP